jgi:hypothetical protein
VPTAKPAAFFSDGHRHGRTEYHKMQGNHRIDIEPEFGRISTVSRLGVYNRGHCTIEHHGRLTKGKEHRVAVSSGAQRLQHPFT